MNRPHGSLGSGRRSRHRSEGPDPGTGLRAEATIDCCGLRVQEEKRRRLADTELVARRTLAADDGVEPAPCCSRETFRTGPLETSTTFPALPHGAGSTI